MLTVWVESDPSESRSSVQIALAQKWQFLGLRPRRLAGVAICKSAGASERVHMSLHNSEKSAPAVTRDRLAELLNEDLAREYQASIGYVVHSQVLKGAEFMSIAAQLEVHAAEELKHALIISQQIDYLGKMPNVTPKIVRTSENAREMLRFDLENENETITNYRERVRQCESLGEFAMAELIRQILVDEQDHQIDLATALGENVPDLSGARSKVA